MRKIEGLRTPLAAIAVSAGLAVGGHIVSHGQEYVSDANTGYDQPVAILPENREFKLPAVVIRK